jgi:hypothetical protein
MVVPGVPASSVTAAEPWPLAIVPPDSVHAYVEPSCAGALAGTPVAPTGTQEAAEIAGAGTGGATVTVALPVPAAVQRASWTLVTV